MYVHVDIHWLTAHELCESYCIPGESCLVHRQLIVLEVTVIYTQLIFASMLLILSLGPWRSFAWSYRVECCRLGTGFDMISDVRCSSASYCGCRIGDKFYHFSLVWCQMDVVVIFASWVSLNFPTFTYIHISHMERQLSSYVNLQYLFHFSLQFI